MKIKERALALFISLVMVLTLMPALAFAYDGWSAEAKNIAPVLEGGEAELEVVIHEIEEFGAYTFKWYKIPNSGTGTNIELGEDEYAKKITVTEPGIYRCVITDIDGRTYPVDFYVTSPYPDAGWTAQIQSISVSFTQNEDNQRFQFREDTDKTKIWRFDESDEEVEIDGYDYDFCNGDTITATLTDGTIKTVVAKEQTAGDYTWIKWYVLEDEDYLQGGYYAPSLEDDQYKTPWTPEGDNTFWVMFGGIEDEEGNLTAAESTPYKATIIPATPADDLEAAKTAAKAELTGINTSAYSGNEKTNVEKAIEDGIAAIEAAATIDAVNAAKITALNTINAQKTDAQKAAEANSNTTVNSQPSEIMDLPIVKISKPKAAKKKITVKWKKVSKKNLKKISGIQIQVSTDPNFSTILKTVPAGKKKTSKVIKGLQSKTTYYVRIRACAAGNHVSDWKSKSVKVK